MFEKDILSMLPYGELDVASIVRELEARHVPLQGKSSIDDLSEILRKVLEKGQPPDILAQLRRKEIDAVRHANKKDALVAKLKSRSLVWTGNKSTLIDRLTSMLEMERNSFENQAKAREVHQRQSHVVQDREKEGAAQKPSDHAWSESKIEKDGASAPSRQEATAKETQNKENDPKKKPSVLTKDQLKWIEQKRKRALELQAEHNAQKSKRQATIAPSTKPQPASLPTTSTDVYNFKTPEKVGTTEAAVVTDEKICKAASTISNRAASLAADDLMKEVTNPYRTKSVSSPPREAASVSSTTPTDVNSRVAPCVRCGNRSGKGLCLVWKHSGQLERERESFYGHEDQFRWNCCGRLDPQPCFVGIHCRSPEDQDQKCKVVLCRCRKPAHLKRTRKHGSNAGRYFFRCNSVGFGSCDFFHWADQTFGLPKQVPLVAHDGFRDWEFPWANPFEEPDLMKASLETKRKRLVAALLLREMCALVDGSTGSTCNMAPFSELIQKVMEVLPYPEKILDRLLPLKPDQVAHRFNSLAAVQDVTEQECGDILWDLVENSPWAKTVGLSLEVPPNEDSKESFAINLSGLRTYLQL